MTEDEKHQLGSLLNKEYTYVEFIAGRKINGYGDEDPLAEINKDGSWKLESTSVAVSYDDPIIVMVFSRDNISLADSL